MSTPTQETKKVYTSPSVVDFGDLIEVTQGGIGSGPDAASAENI